MSFEPNVGQAKTGVQYIARGSGYSVQLSAASTVLSLESRHEAPLVMTFSGGHASGHTELDRLPGTANYFLGKDPQSWRHGVPTFGRIRYTNLYPGVDVVYYGSQRRLEYDLIVAPGSDPNQIRLHFSGAGKPKLNSEGELAFEGPGNSFTQHVPVAYQLRDGVREPVEAHYRVMLSGDVAFSLGAYDRSRTLTIDPTLSYASYLGGNNNDGISAVKVDAAGSMYIAGYTASANFKTTAGAVQGTSQGRTANGQYFGFGDAFVAKLNPAGTALLYCTYLGGAADDFASSLAIDASGNAYVAGSTQSANFPVTAGAYQTRFGGKTDDAFYSRGDAFVVKLSPAGDRIIWGTFLGGTSNDMAWAIAIDSSGNPTIVGDTISTDFPVTANAISKTFRGGANSATNPSGDAFVAKFNAAGTTLLYSSYIGGKSHDMARAVSLDAQGNTYIAGGTYSSDFPTTPGAFQVKGGVVETSDYDGAADDGWIMKINSQGAIVYSTYLGGSYRDTIFGLAVDAATNVYVTGRTRSANFPVTANPLQKNYGGAGARGSGGDSWDGDAFIAKLNPAGSALVFSTFVGGTADEAGSDIVLDSDGNAYVVGYTLSTEFPTSSDALQNKFAGFGGQGLTTGLPAPEGDVNTGDAFLLKVDATGKLLYSSFFGGSADDFGASIAIDSARNVYIGGVTLSANLPTSSPIQSSYGGGASLFPRGDAFFAKFDFGGKVAAVPTKVSFVDNPPASGSAGASFGSPLTVLVSDSVNAPISGVTVTFTATNATLDSASVTTNAQGRASVNVTLGTVGTASVLATVAALPPISYSITVNPAVTGPAISAIVNGASFLAPIAPGSWITLGGSNFAPARADAAAVPLSTVLGGVRVRVNNNPVPLLFVIGNQINAQLPYETSVGTASVTIEQNGVVSSPFSLKVQAVAPGIFLYGNNRAVAQNVADDGTVSLNTTDNPALPGKLILVYFTGQGALDNPIPTGDVAGTKALSRPVAPYSATVGGQPAAVDFLGMTPGNIALGQANIHIPELPAGDYPVVITIGGQPSNGPMVAVATKK
jgi:uncharacterized protein (TIGR03437 family)